MNRSQMLYRILHWFKRSELALPLEGALGTLLIFYGLSQIDCINLWTILGASLLILCILQIQARLPDRDWQ